MAADDPRHVLLRTTDVQHIAAELAERGVAFERWVATQPLRTDDGQAEVLAAYHADVDRLRARGGFRTVDVTRMQPDGDDPAWPARARAEREHFFQEHIHSDDEVRMVAEGRGCFYLRVGAQICAVVTQAGDMISVPAGTRHWFDMGMRPEFRMIRFLHEDGWVGEFTGDPGPALFPDLDEVLAG
jgi:1,2-dihydroxy-3-keto-5-methylthiopentene dioxygenase